jgi:hypothetical protein
LDALDHPGSPSIWNIDWNIEATGVDTRRPNASVGGLT